LSSIRDFETAAFPFVLEDHMPRVVFDDIHFADTSNNLTSLPGTIDVELSRVDL